MTALRPVAFSCVLVLLNVSCSGSPSSTQSETSVNVRSRWEPEHGRHGCLGRRGTDQ